jgi:hypothetical protein
MNTSTASPPTPNLELLHKAVQKFRLNPRRVPFNNLKPFHDSIVELHFDQSQTDLHPLFGRLDTALKAAQGSNERNIANSLCRRSRTKSANLRLAERKASLPSSRRRPVSLFRAKPCLCRNPRSWGCWPSAQPHSSSVGAAIALMLHSSKRKTIKFHAEKVSPKSSPNEY